MIGFVCLCAVAAGMAGCDLIEGKKSSSSTGLACGPAGSASAAGDPLFPLQWYLQNDCQTAYADTPGTVGEDIALGSTAQTGSGITVAVVDTGLELAHEDLAPNVVAVSGATSCDLLSGLITTSNCSRTDPTSTASTGDHGTSVAGLIAARLNNQIGMRGVAGLASLVGFNFLQAQGAANQIAALGGATWSSGVFIFNQSYGTGPDTSLKFVVPSPLTDNSTVESQLISGVSTLRGGKGALYVKSAGNGFAPDYATNAGCVSGLSCDNASMDSSNAVPWQIVVGAINAAGKRASYSTAGSALWVSAPGGEFGGSNSVISCSGTPCSGATIQPAMVTTDQSGCSKGYSVNVFDTTNRATINKFILGQTPDNSNCNYTSGFNGTSSAAPVVSGVIALMLEANPRLSWREVKHILALTSTMVDASAGPTTLFLSDGAYLADPGWISNGSGYHFHNWYGFGRINAAAAVAAASAYGSPLLPAKSMLISNPYSCPACSGAIPDNSVRGVSGTIAVSGAPGFIEALQVTVWVTHRYLGDVGIELTSPMGTRSVVLQPNNAYGAYPSGLSGITFLSNAFYGEDPNGTWRVKAVDGAPGFTGSLSALSVQVYGH
jgi:subtilisin family serine protease